MTLILQAPDLTEAERTEYARTITEQSRRLADLIANILKLNRLENQQIYPESKRYNLGEQLAKCLLNFESTWDKFDYPGLLICAMAAYAFLCRHDCHYQYCKDPKA